ncbi:hypothetical protein TgHK011_003042 [Trichoderma gracile]|nr:hypothetical protein TgHK011_003042 [Trichoderma gracile]
MTGLAYTAFVVPIPTADDYADVLATLTLAQDLIRGCPLLSLSPSFKGRLSSSSSRFSFGSFTSGVSIDDDDSSLTHNHIHHRDNHGVVEDDFDRSGTGSVHGNDMARRKGRRRRSKGASMLRRLRVLVDERVRLRRTGYAPIDDAIEMR